MVDIKRVETSFTFNFLDFYQEQYCKTGHGPSYSTLLFRFCSFFFNQDCVVRIRRMNQFRIKPNVD